MDLSALLSPANLLKMRPDGCVRYPEAASSAPAPASGQAATSSASRPQMGLLDAAVIATLKRKAEPAGVPVVSSKRAAAPQAAAASAAAPQAAAASSAASPKAAASSAAAAAASAVNPACPYCGKSDEALLECGGPSVASGDCEEATRACEACATKPNHPDSCGGGSALLARCELCDSLYCSKADDCAQSLETCAGCNVTHCWRCGDWHVCDKCGDFFCSDCEDLKTSKGGLSECASCQPWYKRGRPAADFCKGCGSSDEDAVLCQKCGKRECHDCGGTPCGECGSGQWCVVAGPPPLLRRRAHPYRLTSPSCPHPHPPSLFSLQRGLQRQGVLLGVPGELLRGLQGGAQVPACGLRGLRVQGVQVRLRALQIDVQIE